MKKLLKVILGMFTLVLLLSQNIEAHADGITDMVFDQTYSGQTSYRNNKVDTYKFIVSKAGLVGFDFTTDGDVIVVELYNENNLSIDYSYHIKDSGHINYRLNPGTYYLEIIADQFYTGCKYTVSASFTDANETFNYANEFISDLTSRNSIPFSTWIYGQMALTEEHDYYKLVLPKKGKITLDLKRLSGKPSNNFYLYDKSSRQIDVSWLSSSMQAYSMTYTLEKGTYYIGFDRAGTGIYNFKVSYSKDAISTLSVKKASKKSIVVKANKAGAISGYEIRYKSGSGSWKTVSVKGSKNLNKIIKGLKKKATYTVQIRTYYTYNGTKLYSSWSGSKKVKLK